MTREICLIMFAVGMALTSLAIASVRWCWPSLAWWEGKFTFVIGGAGLLTYLIGTTGLFYFALVKP